MPWLLLIALTACKSADTTETDTGVTGDDTDTSAGDDTDTNDTQDTDTNDTDTSDTGTSGVRTLDNCGTSIGTGVSAFYSRYFRCVTVTAKGANTELSTKDLPPHLSYYYGASDPNYAAWDDRGGDYHANPNTLSEQNVVFPVPNSPVSRGLTITPDMIDLTAGTSEYEYPGGMGMALDGTVMFDSTAAPGDDIEQEKWTFDTYDGHPQNTGMYHYHSASHGPLEVMEAIGVATTNVPGEAEIELYGIMCDGTIVLGCTELDGSPVDASKLDAQNGHLGDIQDEKGTTYFTNRYHTHACEGLPHGTYTPEIQYYEGCDFPKGG